MAPDDQNLMNTFIEMLGIFRPHLICDIGSMDGAHSIYFRNASSSSRIICFEANPYLYAATVQSQRLVPYQIEWENLAISNVDGVASFNTLVQDYGPNNEGIWRKGGSSLLHRRIGDFQEQPIVVPSRRLDGYLQEKGLLHCGKALWIDAEGAADLVLQGAGEALKSTIMIHVEVEGEEMFFGQCLDRNIIALLKDAGFVPILSATPSAQYDILFMSARLLNLPVWQNAR
jgi:FkbM family methyltransferase